MQIGKYKEKQTQKHMAYPVKYISDIVRFYTIYTQAVNGARLAPWEHYYMTKTLDTWES